MKLAEFTKPPLVEVVAGVQFAKLDELSAAKIGLFWEKLEPEFSLTQDHPPLAPLRENFDRLGRARSLQLLQQPTTPRIWFHNAETTKILQIQNDRLIFNWRKATPAETYPRYSQIKKHFVEYYEKFFKFVLDTMGRKLDAETCELTYVNHIAAQDGLKDHQEIGKIFQFSPPIHLGLKKSTLEEGRLNLVYRLPERGEANRPTADHTRAEN